MNRSEDYRQIYICDNTKYDELKGKVIDKIAFNNDDSYDCCFCLVLFTDKTYIAIGLGHNYNGDVVLENYHVDDPQCINGGDYSCHMYLDGGGNIHFDRWIQILKDFGIWEIDENDAAELIEKKHRQEEEREYALYLKLKEKYEKK